MITLRENQTEPINKTAFVAKNSNDNMIVLQPSKELLEQNYLKYCSLCGDFALNAGIYSASFGRKDIAQITYATIGSIKNLGAKFKALGFTKMLIDEAHLYPREADSISRFRAGEIRVIFNVRVLSTGFDYTGIDCILIGTPAMRN